MDKDAKETMSIQDAFLEAKQSLAAQSEEAAPEQPASDDTSAVQEEASEVQAGASEEELEAAESPKEEQESEDWLKSLEATNPDLAKRVRETLELEGNLKKWRAKLTQEAQQIAEIRKELDKYVPYIQQLQQNPKQALEQLARELGVADDSASEEVPELSGDLDKQLREAISRELPEGWEFIADSLAKPMAAFMQRMVEQQLTPLQRYVEQQLNRQAEEKIETTLREFEQRHPDWKKHEQKMLELFDKLVPNGSLDSLGMEPIELLELLYRGVTADLREAEAARRKIERQAKAVANAEPELPRASRDVIPELKPGASIWDAYRAAKAELEGKV